MLKKLIVATFALMSALLVISYSGAAYTTDVGVTSIGVATATSINKVAITAPATSATLTIADGKTLTASNTLTFTGTDASSVAFGAGGTVLYNGGALGTPSSGTATNLTGLPLTSGVTGVLPTANGGTNTSTAPVVGYIPVASSTSAYTPRAISGTLAKTGNYTVVAADANKVIKCDASGGAFTITLTAAATLGDGFVVTILKTSADTATSTNAVTVDANSTETISGALDNRLQGQYSHVSLICDGSNWQVLSANDWIHARITTSTAMPGSSGAWADGTSLALPPGEWDFSSAIYLFKNSGTMTQALIGISSTSGNSSSGIQVGDNRQDIIIGTLNDESGGGIASYRVVSTTTVSATWYFKMNITFTGSPQYQCRLSARRVR